MSNSRSREVRRLEDQCARARNVVADLFCESVVTFDDDPSLVAWGQYLDLRRRRLSRQYGIYGIASGMQVLAWHEADVHRALLERAARTLPLHVDKACPEGEGVRRYFTEKGDLNVVYKVAALVDAVRPDSATLSGSHPAVVRLLDMRHPGGGWSEFRSVGLDHLHGPKVHATACALLALSRFTDIRDGVECREAAEWLARHADPDVLSIATLAMCSMVLRSYADSDGVSRRVDAAACGCLRAVLEWATRSAPEDVLRALEATEYLLPKPDMVPPLDNERHEFTFLIYSPHCLAALTLMRTPTAARDPHARRFVLEVVRVVAKRICDSGSFIAAGRTVVSSVEHMWIYRLLREFQHWDPYPSRFTVLLDWLTRLLRPSRWVTMGALSVAAWVLLSQSGSILSGLLLTALTTVLLTVVTTLIYDDIFYR